MITLKIQNILDKKDKTIYWLAKQCGVTYQTMHKIVNNKTDSIHFSVLEKICTVLDCELTDILELQKEEK